MILLTRLNGTEVGINADLIERVEASGDTVVSLIDGTRYVVSETPAEVVERVVQFRARVLVAADLGLEDRFGDLEDDDDPAVERSRRRPGSGPLRLVVEHEPDPDESVRSREHGG